MMKFTKTKTNASFSFLLQIIERKKYLVKSKIYRHSFLSLPLVIGPKIHLNFYCFLLKYP